MGYYIETKLPLNKARQIEAEYGAKFVTQEEAEKAMDDTTKAVICVVSNGPFDAAAFAYSKEEFRQFTLPIERDPRPKQFLTMDRRLAKSLTGYKGD